MSTPDDTASPPVPTGAQYVAIAASPEFAKLRRTLYRFVFPMTAFFLLWYTTYVLMGAFAHGFMATPVWGNINAGLLLGLLQFLTTFVITGLYVRFADRRLDPEIAAVRADYADGKFGTGGAE